MKWLTLRPTLIIQGIILIYVFLFYGDMTKMNVGENDWIEMKYAFSKTVTSGTIQSGTVGWMCVIVIDIVLERIFFVRVSIWSFLDSSECFELNTTYILYSQFFFTSIVSSSFQVRLKLTSLVMGILSSSIFLWWCICGYLFSRFDQGNRLFT